MEAQDQQPASPRSLVECVREAIVEAMRATRGNKDGAAYILGIGRATLYRKLKSFEIEPSEYMAAKAAGA